MLLCGEAGCRTVMLGPERLGYRARLWRRIFGGAESVPAEDKPNAGRRGFIAAEEQLPPRDRDALLHLIARNGAWLIAKDINGDEIKFSDYIDEDGIHIWPLFSTQETASTWVSHQNVTEVKIFQCLKLKPAAVLRTIPSRARVVFDATSAYETTMTTDDIAMLKSLIDPE